MSRTNRLERMGFDTQRLRFALRTASAACLALALGWWLGLEHPQWSAMTVWAASQPFRGHLLEKGFFRFAGTVSGTLVGVVLVMLSAHHPGWLVIGLAGWIGLCAGIGNVQRSFVSYGTLLAGYSAAMVALLGSGENAHIGALAIDRLLTVLLGVAVALCVGWRFAPHQAGDATVRSLHCLGTDILRAMARRMAGQVSSDDTLRGLLSRMAAIDDTLDPLGAGSLRSRQSVRAIRKVLSAQVSALLWLGEKTPMAADEALATELERLALAMETADSAEETARALERAAQAAIQAPALQTELAAMAAAWHGLTASVHTPQPRHARSDQPVVLHRDWVGAREAMIRATAAMLLVGALWLLTGWTVGPYMLLGTAIMVSLFSTFDNPALSMRSVFWGQLFGVSGALACRWLFWPFATGEAGLVVLMMPFIYLGALLLSHRRTLGSGFDYNMVVLLLLQPSLPLAGSPGHSLLLALAVLLAPMTAAAAYRLVYPASPRRRLDTLVAMMVRELQALAADPQAGCHRQVWRARLYHRLLRLVRWIEKTDARDLSAIGGGLAVLHLGRAVFHVRELLNSRELSTTVRRQLETLLASIHGIADDPSATARTLAETIATLPAETRETARLLECALHSLEDNCHFFRRDTN